MFKPGGIFDLSMSMATTLISITQQAYRCEVIILKKKNLLQVAVKRVLGISHLVQQLSLVLHKSHS